MKTDRVDVLVVGAGPGGCRAAWGAAGEGVDTLLVEKRPVVGVPTLCAEAMGHGGFSPDLSCRPSWVAAEVTGVVLVSPRGRRIRAFHPSFGYLFHRDRMVQDLAQMAVERGAALRTRARAVSMVRDGESWRVRLDNAGEDREVVAKVVLGADGIESQVIRWAGLGGEAKLRDLMICAQSRLVGTGLEPGVLEFYFGRETAPGGYAWAFPKADAPANVGVGIRLRGTGGFIASERAVFYRDRLVKRLFPRAGTVEEQVGGVPTTSRPPALAGEGVALVGDAGRLADPLTGAGIGAALRSGEDAGRAAARDVRGGGARYPHLAGYARQWVRQTRHYRAGHLWLRNLISPLPDEEMERVMEFLAAFVKDKDPSTLTATDFLRAASRHLPGLLRAGWKAFRSGRGAPERETVPCRLREP